MRGLVHRDVKPSNFMHLSKRFSGTDSVKPRAGTVVEGGIASYVADDRASWGGSGNGNGSSRGGTGDSAASSNDE